MKQHHRKTHVQLAESGCPVVPDGEMEQEMHKTMKQLSEYALLGVGAADSLFPSSLDEMYAFNGTDEQEWRVVL